MTGTSNNGGISAASLSQPKGLAFDATGNLYIADFDNHRVLVYAPNSTTAFRVYGQLNDFATGTANKGGVSADSLNTPVGAALDTVGNLYVADGANHSLA